MTTNEQGETVYVLTRTSGRPRYFARNRASVLSQTYANIVHIVCVDDEESASYVEPYRNEREGNSEGEAQGEAQGKAEGEAQGETQGDAQGKTQGDAEGETQSSSSLLQPNQQTLNRNNSIELVRVQRKPAMHRQHNPHDSYLNTMMDRTVALGAGYIVVLDDDDVFARNDSIQTAVSLSKNDSLTLWRVRIGESIVPQTNAVVLNRIDMNGFMLHNKWCSVFRFDEHTKTADYYFLKQVSQRLPIVWSRLVLTQTAWRTRPQGASGARCDLLDESAAKKENESAAERESAAEGESERDTEKGKNATKRADCSDLMKDSIENMLVSPDSIVNYAADSIHIVVTTDQCYAPYCVALLNSIVEHNRENITQCVLHLFARSTNADFRFLSSIASFCNRVTMPVQFYKLSGPILLQANNPKYISKTTMDRLLIPELLRDDIVTAIYIDVDMLVLCDLRDLLADAADCGETGIAAVDDADGGVWTRHLAAKSSVRIANDYFCFNAGLLVLNLQTLRAKNAQTQWLETANASGVNDQVVLNIYCAGKHNKLSKQYNYMPFNHAVIAAPTKIVHFAGEKKPWNQRELCRKQTASLSDQQQVIQQLYVKSAAQAVNFTAFARLWHWFYQDANGSYSLDRSLSFSLGSDSASATSRSSSSSRSTISSAAVGKSDNTTLQSRRTFAPAQSRFSSRENVSSTNSARNTQTITAGQQITQREPAQGARKTAQKGTRKTAQKPAISNVGSRPSPWNKSFRSRTNRFSAQETMQMRKPVDFSHFNRFTWT